MNLFKWPIRMSDLIPPGEIWVGYVTRRAELTPTGLRIIEDFDVKAKIVNVA